MKKSITILAMLTFIVSAAFAQAPQTFSYQAVVRDASNDLVTNQAVGVKISIKHWSPIGSTVYSETHNPSSNENGLISLTIGNGTVSSGVFADIDWSDWPYYIKTEIDPTGGSTYTISHTQQLMSVPYALYAGEAANVYWDKDTDFKTGVELTGDSTRVTIGNTTGNLPESGRLYFTENTYSSANFSGFEFAYNGDVNNFYVRNGWGLPNTIDTVITIGRADYPAGIPGHVGIGTTEPDEDARLSVVGGTKIGETGIIISDMIELTGTTSSSGFQTTIPLPTGYTSLNCRVMSAAIYSSGNGWYSMGYDYSGASNSLHTVLSDSNELLLRYQDTPGFHSTDYRIILIKIN